MQNTHNKTIVVVNGYLPTKYENTIMKLARLIIKNKPIKKPLANFNIINILSAMLLSDSYIP